MSDPAAEKRARRFVSAIASSRMSLVPALADLVYIAGLASSAFTGAYSGLALVGAAGIAVNIAKSYRAFLSGKGTFPFWWFVPALLIPWTTLHGLSRGAWESGSGAATGQDRFKASATALGVLLAALLILAGLSGTVKRHVDGALAPLDRPGQSYLVETSKQVGIAFATARLLNAMLSVIEDVEISAELGVGGAVSPGEVLEPLDDLVERFSEVMLVSFATVSGLLLMGEIGKLVGLVLLVPLGIFLLCASLWRSPDKRAATASIGYRILILGLFIRLFVPAIGAGSIVLDELVLEGKQAEAVQKMPEFVREKVAAQAPGEETGGEGTELDGSPGGSGAAGLFGILGFGSAIKSELGEMKDNFNRLKGSVPQVVESIVEQIVVFVIKTLVLPLVFLWIILRFYRWLAREPEAGSGVERRIQALVQEKSSPGGASTTEAST